MAVLRELEEVPEMNKENPGDNGGGVTPVSIPNTEVKSSSADGTAYSFCGRVGHCRDFSLLKLIFFCSAVRFSDSFFVFVTYDTCLSDCIQYSIKKSINPAL